MVLVDTNILMYAAGAEHPNKHPCVEYLKKVAASKIDAVLDTEVLQEILHRYRALNRWEDGKKVFDHARTIFPVVIPVSVTVLDRTRELMDQHKRITARDALHASIVQLHSLEAICSYDSDFDRISGLRRVKPS